MYHGEHSSSVEMSNRASQARDTESSGNVTLGLSPSDKYHWFRGIFFQATVVGLAAFTAPGLWNAMNSVGAGGQQTPYLVMYASFLTRFPNLFPFVSLLTLNIETGLTQAPQGWECPPILTDDSDLPHRFHSRQPLRPKAHARLRHYWLRYLLGCSVH